MPRKAKRKYIRIIHRIPRSVEADVTWKGEIHTIYGPCAVYADGLIIWYGSRFNWVNLDNIGSRNPNVSHSNDYPKGYEQDAALFQT